MDWKIQKRFCLSCLAFKKCLPQARFFFRLWTFLEKLFGGHITSKIHVNVESRGSWYPVTVKESLWWDSPSAPHSALKDNLTPLSRFQKDLCQIKPLGHFAKNLDLYFYHRIKRRVKKDGTISYEGMLYEVSFELVILGNRLMILMPFPTLSFPPSKNRENKKPFYLSQDWN